VAGSLPALAQWPYLVVTVVTVSYALAAAARLVPMRDKQAPRYRRKLPAPIWYGGSLVLLIAAAGAIYLLPGTGLRVHTGPARKPAGPESTSAYRLGVFEPGEFASYRRVSNFAAMVGRRPDIVLSYSNWHTPFQAQFADTAYRNGATLLVQLAPIHVSISSIAAGSYDSKIRRYADSIRAFGRRVILSFAPEANGKWYAWGWTHTSPSTWVAAWRHMVTLFREQHAVNVRWAWTINANLPHTGPVRDWWPGKNYVDLIGIDGYYFRRSSTFNSVFGSTIHDVREFTRKPILLSEVGIGQVAGQAASMPGLFAGIKRNRLLGLVWFDMAQHSGLYHQDWRLEGNPAAIAAFRAGLRSLAAPSAAPGGRSPPRPG